MLDRYTVNTDDGTMVVNSYVEPSELSLAEASVWVLKDIVLKCIGGMPDNIDAIRLAENIEFEDKHTLIQGICRWSEREIVICRATLNRKEEFLGVLLHELAHATSKAGDETRSFEQELTNMLGYVATSLCYACNFDADNVVPAKNLDSRYFAYASCKCPTCGGTSFDTNEDKSFAKCVGCGREFSNGYSELVSINRKMIEEQGLSAFINKMVGSMWATNLNDDIFVLEFTDNNNVRFFLTENPPTAMIGDFHYGKYKLNGDTLTFDFKDDIFGLCIMNGKIINDFLNITSTHKEIDGKVTPIQLPMQKM